MVTLLYSLFITKLSNVPDFHLRMAVHSKPIVHSCAVVWRSPIIRSDNSIYILRSSWVQLKLMTAAAMASSTSRKWFVWQEFHVFSLIDSRDSSQFHGSSYLTEPMHTRNFHRTDPPGPRLFLLLFHIIIWLLPERCASSRRARATGVEVDDAKREMQKFARTAVSAVNVCEKVYAMALAHK